MIFRAETLEEAYQKAADYFDKSVSELEIKTIQFPSKGIFGMFAQPAIIEVVNFKEINENEKEEHNHKEVEHKESETKELPKIEEKKEEIKPTEEKEEEVEVPQEETETNLEDIKPTPKEEKEIEEKKETEEKEEPKKDTKIIAEIEDERIEIDDFFKKDLDKYKPKEEKQEIAIEPILEELSIDDVIKILKREVNELFFESCFDLKEVQVSKYNEETILFDFNGNDAALLIGKEGYRYNALSTMLFNWVFQKYGYRTRLEIASFLETQEDMMRKLLAPLINEIEEKGRAKTKPFDGVLAYIALDILREEFPNKYIAIKRNRNGENYIIINEFKK